MDVLDAHVHVGGRYPAVEDYLATMARAGVSRAVLVQQVGCTDNRYLAACVEAHPGRFAAVGMVDPDVTDVVDRVAGLAGEGFAGVRLWAATRSPGHDRDAIWRALAEHGLVASVRGPFADVVAPEFTELLAGMPGLAVRLEHVGFFRYGVDEGFDRLLGLAALPNVTLMWSGFYANSPTGRPDPEAIPFLRASLDAFGPRRIMWSGDWNRGDHQAADDEYLGAAREIAGLDFVSDEDVAWVLGRTAAAVFGMGD